MKVRVIAAVAALIAALSMLVTLGNNTAEAAGTSPAPLIENVPAATSVYGLHDSAGHTMDTLKVVEDPTTPGRYLGVYHWLEGSMFKVGIATSTDLRTWTYRRTLDDAGSQPTLAFSPNGPILALEGKPNDNLRFRYWTSVANMLGTAAPYRSFDAPKTLSPCAEGTPDIRSVKYASDSSVIDSGSTIVVGHHYFQNCDTDRQAVGTLTNFGTWTTSAQPELDQKLTDAGAVGKHGDRDRFTYDGGNWILFEGGITVESTMGDWENFLYSEASGTVTRLDVKTKGGSAVAANPSVTVLKDPAGVPSLLVSQFIASEGAAPGEGGQLLYWQPLPTGTTPTTPPTTEPTPTSPTSPPPGPTPINSRLIPTADSYVNADHRSTNYGTSSRMQIDGSPNKRGFVMFNVQGLGGQAGKAILRLYAHSTRSDPIDIHKTGTSWTERGLTYSNQPGVSGTPVSKPTRAGEYVELDVTSMVTGDGPVAFRISTAGSRSQELSTKESSHDPELVVCTRADCSTT
jgi:hypothetical protein